MAASKQYCEQPVQTNINQLAVRSSSFGDWREDGMVGDLLLGYPMPDDETLTALELELHKHKLT
ncbi:uncharacterized protein RAG0_11685 [Rhynchosporium agropyri]|uniref:Uncharacterized protein n=1 Tax=Rhynchosporium agropyri TaxID=914238 RepID=A0A1E1L5A1_9HELO|nr:uncharacterized protein RAG0_11685 [Rhynchosporium agropyri]